MRIRPESTFAEAPVINLDRNARCRQSVVTALADLERLGFITRIRRVTKPLGFTTRQITNAYEVHEPKSGLGLLAMARSCS